MCKHKLLSHLLLFCLLWALTTQQATEQDLRFYKVTKQTQVNSTTTITNLTYVQDDTWYIKSNNSLCRNIAIIMTLEGEDRLDIRIVDSENPNRFEVPDEEPFPASVRPPKTAPKTNYNVFWVNEPAAFVVVRADTNETILDTTARPLIFSDKYLELTLKRTSPYLHGFGERWYRFDFQEGNYTIWSRDNFLAVEDGQQPGKHLYGQFPIYLTREGRNRFHLCYMRNIAAMDIQVSKDTFTYKMVGGIIHMKLFLSDKYPETAIKEFHKYIGGWRLMPFWTLGFHQSRWGYKEIHEKREVLQKYREAGIPLEALWNDIDYTYNNIPLTVNNHSIQPEQLIKLLEEFDVKFVINTTPVIATKNEDAKKLVGLEKLKEITIKNTQGEPLVGNGWAQDQWYPDFFHRNISHWWWPTLDVLKQSLPYNALWVDMNEFSNFCLGECNSKDYRRDIGLYDAYRRQENNWLPYLPSGQNLEFYTLSLNATHDRGFIEFYFHGTNGMFCMKTTHEYMVDRMKLKYPFLLSRSLMPGAQKYGFHWSGDQNSHEYEFTMTQASIFNFQIFGVTMFGIDILGFAWGNNVDGVFVPWLKEGMFYPFARQHAHSSSQKKEFYQYGDDFTQTARDHVKLRYSILKFYFSLFVRNNHTGTVFRPLFFEFPEDDSAYTYEIMHSHFTLGCELLVVIAKFHKLHLPQGIWYDFYQGHVKQIADNKGIWMVPPEAYKEMARMYIREGHIVPVQDVRNVWNTKHLNNEFELRVGLRKGNDGYYDANGTILGIANYSSEEDVSKCDDENNCLMNVHVEVSTNGTFEINVNVSAKPNPGPFYMSPEVRIANLSLMGIRVTDELNELLKMNGKEGGLCVMNDDQFGFASFEAWEVGNTYNSHDVRHSYNEKIITMLVKLPEMELANPLHFTVVPCEKLDCDLVQDVRGYMAGDTHNLRTNVIKSVERNNRSLSMYDFSEFCLYNDIDKTTPAFLAASQLGFQFLTLVYILFMVLA